MSLTPIVQLPTPFMNALNSSWLSTTTLSVGAGSCWDSTFTFPLSLSGPVTISGAINGVNGLDTGSLANNQWYAIFIIGDSQGYNPTQTLISLSPTSPVMPNGQTVGTSYNLFRQIGWVNTDGSAHFLKFYQVGTGSVRTHYFDSTIQVLNMANATTFTNVDCSFAVPPVNNTLIYINTRYQVQSADNQASIKPANSTAIAGNVMLLSCVVASEVQVAQSKILTQVSSGKAEFAYLVAQSGDALTVGVMGFEYYL